MEDTESLQRLGRGRWRTKDGRFLIEPQSGTWTVVDTEHVDDLGLPLVRGPFRSLTAAREAIGQARVQGATVSPLASIVESAKARPATTSSTAKERDRRKMAARRPKEPAEPTWLARLEEPRRREARTLLRRLERAGVPDPAAIVRAELVDDRPVLTQLAIERRLRALVDAAADAESAARSIAGALVHGDDATLGVGWRLTDASGRPIRRLDLARDDET
jgi:hypothetical protein